MHVWHPTVRSAWLQALQDSILQLEARASTAEAGKAAAHRQLAQARQQLAVKHKAYESDIAAMTDHIAKQDAVLAGAAKYLGPLESRANPVSPALSPRMQPVTSAKSTEK